MTEKTEYGGSPQAKVEGLGSRFITNLRAGYAALVRPPCRDDRLPAWPQVIRVLAGVLAIVATTLLAMATLDGWWLASAPPVPPSVVAVFRYVTNLGFSGWFLVPLGVTLLMFAVLKRADAPWPAQTVCRAVATRLGFVFTAIAGPGIVVAIAKLVIGRARPNVPSDDGWSFPVLDLHSHHASLPSGHTATAFAAAVAVGAIWPQSRMVMWTYAVVIAASRMIVHAHHPSDVIAGAMVGALGALFVRTWFARRQLVFRFDAAGRVQCDPAPTWRQITRAARECATA